MKITICLVTKGRKEYLTEVLKSFEPAMSLPDIGVLIIDNGSASAEKQILSDWAAKYPNNVNLVRNEQNDIHPAKLMNTIRKLAPGWIVLPGDDDIFLPEILSEIQMRIASNPKLVAVASSAQAINEVGAIRNEIFTPYISKSKSFPEALAGVFHEPPFTWPALFFDVTRLPSVLPNSRYVFDWWVGIQLVLAGEVSCTDKIGLKYRIHSGQESNLTGTRRKFLEANLMLHNLIQSDGLVDHLENMNQLDLRVFWKQLLRDKPVYGNQELFHGLIAHLLQAIGARTKHKELSLELSAKYAADSGVFLAPHDIDNFFTFASTNAQIQSPNVQIEVTSNSCSYFKDLFADFQSVPESRTFLLSCSHESSVKGAYLFECERLMKLPPDEAIGFVLKRLTDSLEQSGVLSFSISSGEKWLINLVRKSRKYLPKSFLARAKGLKG